jgi:Ca-activated chloride channel family protein
MCSAELQHTFISTASRPANVTYIFPLPPDASVHAFRAQIDERVVEGVVMEKEKARETFDTAVANHQQAALLQQENVEIFKIILGNVSPGQTVVVSSVLALPVAQARC